MNGTANLTEVTGTANLTELTGTANLTEVTGTSCQQARIEVLHLFDEIKIPVLMRTV